MTSIIDKYNNYLLLEKGFSPNTAEAYVGDVLKFFNFMEDEGLEARDVKLDDLHHFAASLYDIGLTATTMSRILSGVRSFFHYLLEDGYITDDPTELLEMPQRGEHLPTVLTVEEVDALEDAVDRSQDEALRDRAIVEVLYSCGLRVSELCSLQLTNVFLDDGFLQVMGKGRKQRLVPISPRAVTELKIWLSDRESIEPKPGEEDYVFLSHRRRQHLSRITVFHVLQVLALHAPYRLTRFATRLPPTYSKAVPTYVPFKLCWGTSVLIRRRYTPTSTAPSSNNKCWSICHEINRVASLTLSPTKEGDRGETICFYPQKNLCNTHCCTGALYYDCNYFTAKDKCQRFDVHKVLLLIMSILIKSLWTPSNPPSIIM